jgi:hypothetical protein
MRGAVLYINNTMYDCCAEAVEVIAPTSRRCAHLVVGARGNKGKGAIEKYQCMFMQKNFRIVIL